ncbi:hypothetical protein [Lacipirellula parvula]|uniref:Uncharacterized protein n=1 Tax=Lacipirellula parvula TaxID=2650471 RepID=A0A5K7XKU9_9BACT|nr:hypothetical protein [Lacipirellula parvula]BBO35156.1 hypothetical protein PLANPX_4768 [Lacipirellula parvula]
MGSSVTSEARAEPHVIEVDGRSIECASLSEALALKMAEHIAKAGFATPDDRVSLARVIQVARKHGFDAIVVAIEKL